MYFLLSLLFIGAVSFFIRNYLKRSPSLKVDYSFGNANLLALEVAVRAKQFKEAEVLIRSFEVNMRTLAIDHLALTCTTLELQSWVTSNGGTGYDGLALATHYGLLNWAFEQTKTFANATKTEQKAFTFNSENGRQHLDLVENSRSYFFEKQLRLIRLKMITGEIDAAWNHFIAATNQEPDTFFPYLYAAECIQPKWGGDLNRIQKLIAMLPELPEVRMCVMLKLIQDSFSQEENLFGGTMDDLVTFATEQLALIDNELSKEVPDSGIKYYIYNYVIVTSERLGNKVLKQKYIQLAQGYTTLFPYGPIFPQELAQM